MIIGRRGGGGWGRIWAGFYVRFLMIARILIGIVLYSLFFSILFSVFEAPMPVAMVVSLSAAIFLVFLAKPSKKSIPETIKSLGDLRGRTKDDLIAALGSPTASSAVAAGQILLQWMPTGYHIALLFDHNGICLGITHEFSAPRR
jgi:hypothetical protein